MSLTHWKKLTNPNYLGAYSIENGKDLVLTIDHVCQENVVGPDGKKEDCTVCYFSNADKPMILNSTNAKMIQKLSGTPYIEQWKGFTIQVGVEKVKAFGDVVEALRVRKYLPKAATIKCEKCGKIIFSSNNMSPEQLAGYTKQKYGMASCANCAMALSQKQIDEKQESKGHASETN